MRERVGENKARSFANLFSEALDLVDEANEYSKYRYHHFKNKDFKIYFTIEVMIDLMSYEDDDPEIAIRMRYKDTGNFINHSYIDDVITLWDYEKFKQRVEMMNEWYTDILEDGILNRQKYFDPWSEVTDESIKEKLEGEHLSLEDQHTRIWDQISKLEYKRDELKKLKDEYFSKNKEAWNAKERDLNYIKMILINEERAETEEEEDLIKRYDSCKNKK